MASVRDSAGVGADQTADTGAAAGAGAMLTFSPFLFGASTTTYEELQRRTEYRWPAQDRLGRRPSYQSTGPGEDHITFERLKRIADGLGIDVVSQYDHIVRVGGQLGDARWPHDAHWSPTGHRWAAEALFEYISRNQHICEQRTPSPSPVPN